MLEVGSTAMGFYKPERWAIPDATDVALDVRHIPGGCRVSYGNLQRSALPHASIFTHTQKQMIYSFINYYTNFIGNNCFLLI